MGNGQAEGEHGAGVMFVLYVELQSDVHRVRRF